MQIPNFGEHNKAIWAGLLIGAVALGLYLRRRSYQGQGATSDQAGNDLPNMPNVSDAMDPYSGTDSVTGTGSIPGPPGPTGPPGPRGKTGHTRNQHHGSNGGGHGGKGGAKRHHRHTGKGGTASTPPVLVHGTIEHHPSVNNTPHHKKRASR